MKILQTYLVCKLALVTLLFAVGCHRSYYRRQADADAQRLIEEKSMDPHWAIPNFSIDIDPASRMYDPFSLDHPPMPPDDPSAAEFMRTVDGKPGFPRWHANGDTPYVENPEWRYLLPVDEDGKLNMDLDQAVELALMHSPEYQRQLETLFLSALDVSLERFDLETQFFFPLNNTLTTEGRIRNGGSASTTLRSANGAGARLSKAGITGSTMVVAFANSLLWEFSGVDSHVGFGSLSFELIQPLLRNAGRDVILESLTDSERGLLYNVRQFERFRRGFAQDIAAGINSGTTVQRGSGSIGGVSGVSINAGGLLGLLQNLQNIRIQEGNISSQRNLLEQFEEYFNSERIDLLQLKQFQSNLYTSQSGLLRTKAGYQGNLDNFKIQLGLPPDLDVGVDDPILEQFELIDEKITARQKEVGTIRKSASDIFVDITELIGPVTDQMKANRESILREGGNVLTDLSWTDDDIEWTDELKDLLQRIRAELDKIKPVYQRIIEIDFPQTESDIQRLERSIGKRRESLLKLREKFSRSESGTPVIEDKVLNPDDPPLESLVEERKLEYRGGVRPNGEPVKGARENVLKADEDLRKLLRIWDLILANEGRLPESELNSEYIKGLMAADPTLEIAVKSRAGTIKRFISEPGPEVLTILDNLIIDNSLIQVLARVDSLMLPIVDMDWVTALDVARENRRDWMNARAQLVDQWRNIEVSADTLESQLDLTFGGDLQNVGDNPLRLRDRNGRMRIGLQFDAPITRLAERNNYREALISYQRTKRTYYQFEDRVSAQLREILRQIEVAKLNFELSRIQVKNSVDQVQLASYNLVRPPAPGAGSNRLGSTVARDLINALQNLQREQSDLIRNWVNFEVLRRQLDLHMGTMQLDENGYWIDPVEITADSVMGIMSSGVYPDAGTMADPGAAPMELPPNNLAPNNLAPANQNPGEPDPGQLNRVLPVEEFPAFQSQLSNPNRGSREPRTSQVDSRQSSPVPGRFNNSLYSSVEPLSTIPRPAARSEFRTESRSNRRDQSTESRSKDQEQVDPEDALPTLGDFRRNSQSDTETPASNQRGSLSSLPNSSFDRDLFRPISTNQKFADSDRQANRADPSSASDLKKRQGRATRAKFEEQSQRGNQPGRFVQPTNFEKDLPSPRIAPIPDFLKRKTESR